MPLALRFWPLPSLASLNFAALFVALLLVHCPAIEARRRGGPPFADTPTQRRLVGDGGDDTAFPTIADSTHHLVYEQRADAEARLEADLRREFVRTAMVDKDEMTYRYPKKAYSMIPRKFQCYSCMSTSYENNWHRLQHLYVQPKKFTDDCERPSEAKERMPTVECGSVCVSLVEADVEGGVFLGFKYIRGCINRILTHDFNLSALRTHRMPQMDFCRNVPRAVLFNNPRSAPQVFGEVNLCTCFGDRCNSASQSAAIRKSPIIGILLIFAAFLFRL